MAVGCHNDIVTKEEESDASIYSHFPGPQNNPPISHHIHNKIPPTPQNSVRARAARTRRESSGHGMKSFFFLPPGQVAKGSVIKGGNCGWKLWIEGRMLRR